MKKLAFLLLSAIVAITASAAPGQYELKSPSGRLSATIKGGDKLTVSVSLDGYQVMLPSQIGMTLSNGLSVGTNASLSKPSRRTVDETIQSPFYRRTFVRDHYNELTLRLHKDWSMIVRAYDDGIAYRFVNSSKKPFNVINETAEYRFPTDAVASVPFSNRGDSTSFESQYPCSFENTYTTGKLPAISSKMLAFLPVIVEPSQGVKICLTESALENYPGMFLNSTGTLLRGVFAPYPKKMHLGGHNNLQMIVDEREDFIAKVDGARAFPWRIAVVTDKDTDLAATDLSYILGEPSRLSDTSWIKPGKVAWDWWNAWNLDGVPFRTGVNNDTYKAYIDFASRNGIEYVILDEGWAVNKACDLRQVVPEINIQELVDYGRERNVGIILWAGYRAFEKEMDAICKHYADMGVKGFKVDFMDRDDQIITDFNYKAAATAAKHGLVLDLHGASKPAGLNRTYPNVLNFEGVHGLEQMKWAGKDVDQVTYDVMIPFIRQVAGPMDYTQGAMRNAIRKNYYPCYTEPMSQGTRCRQLALYMVLDSPFNMLCDTPSAYEREPESTAFIAEVPTVWDETKVLDGKMGEYIVTARRKGNVWYIGGLTDWTPRDITVDLTALPGLGKQMVLFSDGINADKIGRDYKRTQTQTPSDGKLRVHLAPGGGFAAKIH